MHVVEQRQNQRFELHLPVRILRSGSGQAVQAVATRNISSGGVLFTSDTRLEIGGTIEYVVTLSNARGVQVDVRCIGKVVRVEKSAADPAPVYNVAATLDRYQFVRKQLSPIADAAHSS